MKAIKCLKWSVEIKYTGSFSWKATTSEEGRIRGVFVASGCWKTKHYAERNWKLFAKLNGIKKWKFVSVSNRA